METKKYSARYTPPVALLLVIFGLASLYACSDKKEVPSLFDDDYIPELGDSRGLVWDLRDGGIVGEPNDKDPRRFETVTEIAHLLDLGSLSVGLLPEFSSEVCPEFDRWGVELYCTMSRNGVATLLVMQIDADVALWLILEAGWSDRMEWSHTLEDYASRWSNITEGNIMHPARDAP